MSSVSVPRGGITTPPAVRPVGRIFQRQMLFDLPFLLGGYYDGARHSPLPHTCHVFKLQKAAEEPHHDARGKYYSAVATAKKCYETSAKEVQSHSMKVSGQKR